MNIEIRRARYEKKRAQYLEDLKIYRDRIAWWCGDRKENEKGIRDTKRKLRKLDAVNPDLAAEVLAVRRSHGFPG